jgi:hypothetical protein
LITVVLESRGVAADLIAMAYEAKARRIAGGNRWGSLRLTRGCAGHADQQRAPADHRRIHACDSKWRLG